MNPMDRWFPRIVLAAALVVCGLECSAEAQPARVDAETVCAVKASLRRGNWNASTCAKVAAALNETRNPVQMLAIAINESDLREHAHRVTMLADGRIAHDLGLAGVRCVVDPTAPPRERDRCTNGAARGLYANQLLDPAVNVRTAEAVLRSHKGSLRGYSGSTKERGYGARIAVLVVALGGELRIPRGAHGAKWARVRDLAKRTVKAINERKQS